MYSICITISSTMVLCILRMLFSVAKNDTVQVEEAPNSEIIAGIGITMIAIPTMGIIGADILGIVAWFMA